MVFIVTKKLNHGTSNPIIARLGPQTQDLTQAFPLTKQQKDEIFEILFVKVSRRLITCYEILETVKSEINQITNEIKKSGLEIQPGGSTITLPQVSKLEEKVESFLYNAKSALRDLSQIFKVFYKKEFDHSRYHEIQQWAEREIGLESPLAKLLADDQLWIKSLVSKRNAVEHPRGYSGYLHIQNYQLHGRFEEGNASIQEPTWHLNDEKPCLIADDLNTYLWNLLEFSEDLLAVCLMSLEEKFPLVIGTVPEEERDPECPIRLRVTLDPEKIRI